MTSMARGAAALARWRKSVRLRDIDSAQRLEKNRSLQLGARHRPRPRPAVIHKNIGTGRYTPSGS
jgi:hypothetical protein